MGPDTAERVVLGDGVHIGGSACFNGIAIDSLFRCDSPTIVDAIGEIVSRLADHFAALGEEDFRDTSLLLSTSKRQNKKHAFDSRNQRRTSSRPYS